MGKQIREIKIPTYYGMEICHVNGISYAFQCLKSVIKYNISRFGIFYEPKFDIANGSTANSYLLKRSPFSINQYIIKTLDNRTKTVIDLGANEGRLSAILAKKIKKAKIEKVFVRHGIIFSPAILIALVLSLIFGNLIYFLF